MQRNEPPLVIHRDYHGGALEHAPEPEPDAFGDVPLDDYSKGIAQFVVMYVHQKLAQRDGYLETEIAALKRALREHRREAAGDRAEMRRERALLYDEIKTLRKRLDLNEHGRVDELPRKARNHVARSKRHE
ncbi:MAG TPA: hypothetical protein VKE42_05120 [Candidatus Cybelea sp.]|nr:hypothetical protein [Candidatus Cybelea sp.]